MIQRPQSLLLLGVAVLLFASTMVPLWSVDRDNTIVASVGAFEMSVLGKQFSTVYLASLSLVSSLLALASIFMYKNRQRQLQIGLVNMGLVLINVLLLVFKTIPDAIRVLGISDEKGNYGYGVFFILGAIVLNFIASKFIRKDDALVKSVDRIR